MRLDVFKQFFYTRNSNCNISYVWYLLRFFTGNITKVRSSFVNTEQNWSLRALALSVVDDANLPSAVLSVETPKTSCLFVLR